MPLRRDTPESLYVQLADAVERDIAGGTYSAFDRLPSEPALMAKYGVSRVTVRQAIALLQRKGLIEVKQGKGTFVAGATVRHGLDHLTGFYDSLIAQGLRPGTRLLEFRIANSTDRQSTVFDSSTRRVIAMRRLYVLGNLPFAVVDGLVAIDALQVSREQVETHTIYQLLRDVIGEQIVTAEIGIRARTVGKKIGALLRLAAGRPALVMERVSTGKSGRPAEHSWFYIVPETYEFRLNVSGPLQISNGIQPFGTSRARDREARAVQSA
jgi:GntR family transcriptional regulator